MAKLSEELGIVEKEGGLGAFRPRPVPGERIQLVLAAKGQETGEGARDMRALGMCSRGGIE